MPSTCSSVGRLFRCISFIRRASRAAAGALRAAPRLVGVRDGERGMGEENGGLQLHLAAWRIGVLFNPFSVIELETLIDHHVEVFQVFVRSTGGHLKEEECPRRIFPSGLLRIFIKLIALWLHWVRPTLCR